MEFSLKDLFLKGGDFMWPLLILAFITVLIVLERSIYYAFHRYRLSKTIRALHQGKTSRSNPIFLVGFVFINATSDGEEHTLNVS